MFAGSKLAQQARLISESKLFDFDFYVRNSGMLGFDLAGIDPIVHFLTFYWRHRLNPHPLFDCAFYLPQMESSTDQLNPVIDYILRKKKLSCSPHPLFDATYYLNQLGDDYDDSLTPLGHFIAFGAERFLNPSRFFDTAFYSSQLSDSLKGINPLTHYLEFGANMRLNPSSGFNTKFYFDRYPDIAASNFNPLVHFVLHGEREGRASCPAFSEEEPLLSSPEPLFDKKALLADYIDTRKIEPLLPATERLDALSRPVTVNTRAARAYFKLIESLQEPFSHLFLMPFLIHGGAEKVAMNMAKCVKEQLGDMAPLVVITDTKDLTALEWKPTGIRLLVLDELLDGLTFADKEQIILRLILQSRPNVTLNFNSDVAWSLYKRHGKQLKSMTKLSTSLFAFGLDSDEIPAGYVVDSLAYCLDNLSYLFSDTNNFRKYLASQFGFSARSRAKQSVLYTPVSSDQRDMEKICKPRLCAQNSNILWASRLCLSKRPDILLAIANELPDLTFHVWGQAHEHLHDSWLPKLEAQANIVLHGLYESFSGIPKGDTGIFLYTSESDGLPIVMLEATMEGYPVIAPLIGGVAEFVGEDTGYLIDKFDDVDAYVAAIKAILDSPEEAINRVLRAQALLRSQHSWSSFTQQMKAIEGFWEE